MHESIKKPRAALDGRVSTDDGRQTTANQLPVFHQLANARGLEPVVYEEHESAAKKRPVFERMIDGARAGEIGTVLVWSLDRMHRSMQGAISAVLELDRSRCRSSR